MTEHSIRKGLHAASCYTYACRQAQGTAISEKQPLYGYQYLLRHALCVMLHNKMHAGRRHGIYDQQPFYDVCHAYNVTEHQYQAACLRTGVHAVS